MKKILYILIISLFFISNAFGADDIVITKVGYTGNLGNDTIINIAGKGFDSCDSLFFDSKKISITNRTSTSISFKFSDLLVYNGEISLNCLGKKYSSTFAFPFIEKGFYDKRNNLRELELTGLNLNGSSVVVKGGTFKTIFTSPTILEGTLSESLTSNELYVNLGGLYSNLFKVDLQIPKIDFIYSENGLFEGEDIYIYGKNLDSYNNSKIYLGTKEVTDFKVLEEGNILKFNSLGFQGNFDIYITSNGFKSNVVKTYIYGKKPVITNVMEKYDGDLGNQFYIYGSGFSRDLTKTDVYINGKKAVVKDIKEDYILLSQYTLIPGNNYIVIFSNGYYSNSGNYFYKNGTLPEISAIDVANAEEGKRSIKIYMNGYSTTDKILFNGSAITPISCVAGMCRVEIDKKIMKGDFRVSRGDYKSKNIISFDLTEKYQPYVEYIRIRETLEKGSRVEIYGRNFYDANISSTNLFSKDSKGLIEIEVSDGVIKGKLANDYDITKNSGINISKYGLSYVFNFSKTNFEEGYVYATPYILSLKSSDYILKEGSLVTINGVGFREGDIVNIGGQKTSLDIKTNSFIIPNGVTKGASTLSIETKDNLKSNTYKVFLYSADSGKNIKVDFKDLGDLNYDTNKGYNLKDVVYKAELSNNLDDLIINKIKFNINGLNEKGLFSLYLDGTLIGDAFLSQDGTLIFDNSFLIPKLSGTKTLYLYSKSSTTNPGTYRVGLNSIDGKYVNYTDLTPEFSLSLLNSNVNYKKSNISLCVDSDAQKLNCNSFLQGKYVTINTVKEEPKQTTTTIINTPKTDNSKLPNYFEIETTYDEIVNKLTNSKLELSLSTSGKKYISQLDVLLPKISKDNQYKLLKKIYILGDKLSTSTSSKNLEIIRLLNYMEAKLEYELTK